MGVERGEGGGGEGDIVRRFEIEMRDKAEI